jgi:hypothetical protein
MIAIGRCLNSNGLPFYNPENGTFVSSIDYHFQNHKTSGAHFGYKYQSGVFIYILDESNHVFTPKYPFDSEVLVYTHSPPHRAKVVGIPTYHRPEIYTVVFLMVQLLNILIRIICWKLFLLLYLQNLQIFLYYLVGYNMMLMLHYFYITKDYFICA